MEKFPPPPIAISKLNFNPSRILLYFITIFIFATARAQAPECGVVIPPEVFKSYIDELLDIDSFKSAQATQTQTMLDVPLRFTNIYGPGSSASIFSNSNADATINYLNPFYAAAGIHFVRCGDVNTIYDDRITDNEDIDHFITSFSYTSGAVEIYLKPSKPPLNAPATAVIPLSAYFDINTNWNFNYPDHNNVVRLRGSGDAGSRLAHELGHHFGLFHTFENASVDFHVPDPITGASQLDFPYQPQPPAVLDPGWWGRELVIRQDVPNDPLRPFKLKNFSESGDLCGDTPADCSTLTPNIWPGCPISAQSLSGCTLNSSLTYKDYNGDPIYPPQAGYSLGRNFMSYWNGACMNEFTPEQYTRMSFYNIHHRQPFYTANRCGTFTDRVEFEGSALPLHNVTLRVRHPSLKNKCNVTSSQTGDFSGMLNIDWLMVHAYHNGLKDELEFPNDALKKHYGHKKCEWRRGVSSIDLTKISQHILGTLMLPSGYSKIAADANLSNSITTFDVIEFRKMLLWENYYIPGLEQPWRFIPESVPQHNPTAFNQNPFALLGGAYLEQGWLYQAPAIGQRGYDGVKMGDVDSSWPSDVHACDGQEPGGGPVSGGGALPAFSAPNTGIQQGEVAKLTFKVQNFQQIDAFQIGLNLPFPLFELQEVEDINLPSYTKEDYFGLQDLETNAFRTLWYSETGVPASLSNNSTLFSIVVKAKQNITDVGAALALDNIVLPNFFHSNANANTSINVDMDLIKEERREFVQDVNSKLRCEPNPFTGVPALKFKNDGTAGTAFITVSNNLGAKVLDIKLEMVSGENSVALPDFSSLPNGAYWLRFQMGDMASTLKIVKN